MFDRIKLVNTIIRNRRALGFSVTPRIVDIMADTNIFVNIPTILDSFEKYGGIVQLNDGIIVSLMETAE